MKKTLILCKFLSAIFLLNSCSTNKIYLETADYVNPFIGTGGHGHTFPGATVPFGMVQLNPNTRLYGWDGCSGYHYSDSVIFGFAHTALSGTGSSDYGDILIMPVVGKPVFDKNEYSSPFKKKNEQAEAGYYKVFLDKPTVWAELTAAARTGFHRYTFPETNEANLIIDLQHRDKVINSYIEFVSDTEIQGMRRSTNFAKDKTWFFYAKFSKPFINKGIAVDNTVINHLLKAQGKNIKAFVQFVTTKNETIEIKVGISAVDLEGAKNNLYSENLDFDSAKIAAKSLWNKELNKIKIGGNNEEQNTIFYTALYHTFIHPNLYTDADNRYRGTDSLIHKAENFTNYTLFSIWDTYRAWFPLMTIINPQRNSDFIHTMLNIYDKSGLLPIWELAANETYSMIGNHAIAVIVDAYMKGDRSFATDKALAAMLHSVSLNHFGLDFYRQNGYISGENEFQSVSKTLEYAYDDWCIARFAKEIGQNEIYSKFIKRSQSYKNLLDVETGFMRPKINGKWLTPFNAATVDWNFTEANSWQYSFYVPQDITGFYTQLGGKERLISQLDDLFNNKDKISGYMISDISGFIGQYAHGNEPSHHIAYLYNFVNQPWKTQHYVRKIMDDFYKNEPNGLIGNEDCGQMSAWFVMSSLGFYPVTPGIPEYIIGTPMFPTAEIMLENGKIFKITANNVSAKNRFIKSAKLNGNDYRKSFITHSDIIDGGHLHFEMDDKPNKNWASANNEIPFSHINEHLILPVPVFNYEAKPITEKITVTIESATQNVEIFYTVDGSVPTTKSKKYFEPITVDKSLTVKAIAYSKEFGSSSVAEAKFVIIKQQ